MSYDIEYVSSVIVTAEHMRGNMTVEQYIDFFSPIQQDIIADILTDLNLVRNEWEEYNLWDDRFDKDRGRYVLRWNIDYPNI
jgi:hypothetical protein